MRKRVISIFAVSVLLSTMSLPYLSLFEVRSLSLDPFSASVAGIGRATRHAVGSNRFSSRFSSLEDELLSLSYIRNVSLSPNSFMSYDVVLEYSDGLILTDGKSFYFFSSEGIEPLDESDAPCGAAGVPPPRSPPGIAFAPPARASSPDSGKAT